jgi:centrosomal protein POC5
LQLPYYPLVQYGIKFCFVRTASENAKLQDEVENLKELLHTYEKSIERKDQVIANLTQGLQKQREKQEKLRAFCDWKVRLVDSKREVRKLRIGNCCMP